MTVTVAELVGQPHLRLEVLAGATGLDRQVTWAHSSDLAEPWDWLAGGELLMKNGRSFPRGPRVQRAFLDRLAASGVPALVIGADPMTPPLARQAAQRADDLRLPVLQVPYTMSFIAISRAVADASMAEQARRVSRTERIYAAIQPRLDMEILAAPANPFVQRIESELGHRVHVLDAATCEPVLAGSSRTDRHLVARLKEALDLRRPHLPAVLHLAPRGRRTAVAVVVPHEEPAVLLADRSDGRGFDLPLLHHAALAAALEIARQTLECEVEQRIGAVTLERLLGTSLDTAEGDPLRTPLLRHGVNPSTCRLLASPAPTHQVRRQVNLGLRRRGVSHLAIAGEAALWILVDAAGPGSIALDTVCERLGRDAPVGVSDVVGNAARLPEASREAQFALGVAAERGGGPAHYGDPGPLLAFRHPAEARAVVERVLGPLLDYDGTHGTELVTSLATFLGCRRSWHRTAAALHVHRQTVVYRLRRVAELTGRDLGETADVAELWLALSAYELLRPRSPSQLSSPL